MDARQKLLTKKLYLSGCGLEISPLFRPIVPKSGNNVFYTDYAPTEELREKNRENVNLTSGLFSGIVDLDFVWTPGSKLSESAPKDILFDYAVASHVIEHVPNVVGWLNEILSVLKVGGVLALAVPNKTSSFDYYRQTTSAAEMFDAWIRGASTPSPKQIFDCLSMAAVDTGQPGTRSFDLDLPLKKANLTYTLEEAASYAIDTYASGDYLDVHCSVFTPESFVDVFQTLVDLKLLNVSISEAIQGEPAGVPGSLVSSEFVVFLTKLGESERKLPVNDLKVSGGAESAVAHLHKAFSEAVAAQEDLKRYIKVLESQLRFKTAIKRVLRRVVGRA